MEQILEELKQIKELLKTSSKDRLLTRSNLIEEYGLTKDETDKVFCSKIIPVIKIGKSYKVSQKTFEEYMQKGLIWREDKQVRKKCKVRIIVRIVQLVIIILTLILTKIAINYAFIERGYEAIGGEYLIPILGLLIVVIIEDEYRKYKNRKEEKNESWKQ